MCHIFHLLGTQCFAGSGEATPNLYILRRLPWNTDVRRNGKLFRLLLWKGGTKIAVRDIKSYCPPILQGTKSFWHQYTNIHLRRYPHEKQQGVLLFITILAVCMLALSPLAYAKPPVLRMATITSTDNTDCLTIWHHSAEGHRDRGPVGIGRYRKGP